MAIGYGQIDHNDIFDHVMNGYKVIARVETNDDDMIPGEYPIEDLTLNTILWLLDKENVTFFATRKER